MLRYRELDWGIEGHPGFVRSQHSDETRKIGYTLALGMSFEGMRPHPWLLAKGTLLPSLGRVVYEVAQWTPLRRLFEAALGRPLGGVPGRYLLFRSISAVGSLALVLLVFALTRALSGSAWAGLLAAVFQATSFGCAYGAVTFKADLLLTTLLAVVFVATVAYVRRPGAARAFGMGAALGVAVAAKHLGALGVALPILACLTAAGLGWRQRWTHLLLAAVGSALLLSVSAPYYLLEPARFIEAVQVTLRYQAERSYHFEGFGLQPVAVITHLLAASLGPPLTLLGLVGTGAAVRRWWRGDRACLPLLGFGLLHFLALCWNAWLVVRYTLPLHPLLCAFAAIWLWSAARWLLRRRGLAARLGVALLAALGLSQVLWFSAFDRMLAEPTPPARAAAWLKEHLPPGASVLELRRRPPVVYGFGREPESLTASQIDTLVEEGRRLSSLPQDYVVLTEEMYRHFFRLRDQRWAPYRRFYSELFDRRRFRPVARFETPLRLPVIGLELPKPFLPEDVLLIAPVTLVFENVSRRTSGSRPPGPPVSELGVDPEVPVAQGARAEVLHPEVAGRAALGGPGDPLQEEEVGVAADQPELGVIALDLEPAPGRRVPAPDLHLATLQHDVVGDPARAGGDAAWVEGEAVVPPEGPLRGSGGGDGHDALGLDLARDLSE